MQRYAFFLIGTSFVHSSILLRSIQNGFEYKESESVGEASDSVRFFLSDFKKHVYLQYEKVMSDKVLICLLVWKTDCCILSIALSTQVVCADGGSPLPKTVSPSL